jgi:hypothetical protein
MSYFPRNFNVNSVVISDREGRQTSSPTSASDIGYIPSNISSKTPRMYQHFNKTSWIRGSSGICFGTGDFTIAFDIIFPTAYDIIAMTGYKLFQSNSSHCPSIDIEISGRNSNAGMTPKMFPLIKLGENQKLYLTGDNQPFFPVGQPVHVAMVFDRDGSGLTYINGNPQTNDTFNYFPTTGFSGVSLGSGQVSTSGSWTLGPTIDCDLGSFTIFNYALNAPEIVSLVRDGGITDIFADVTGFDADYTFYRSPGFPTTGVDGWSVPNSTDGNVTGGYSATDSIGVTRNNCIRFQCFGSTFNGRLFAGPHSSLFLPNHQYRVDTELFIPSTNTFLNGFLLGELQGNLPIGAIGFNGNYGLGVTGFWTGVSLTYSGYQQNITNDPITVKFLSGTNTTWSGVSGDVAYISYVKYTALGCIFDLDLCNANQDVSPVVRNRVTPLFNGLIQSGVQSYTAPIQGNFLYLVISNYISGSSGIYFPTSHKGFNNIGIGTLGIPMFPLTFGSGALINSGMSFGAFPNSTSNNYNRTRFFHSGGHFRFIAETSEANDTTKFYIGANDPGSLNGPTMYFSRNLIAPTGKIVIGPDLFSLSETSVLFTGALIATTINQIAVNIRPVIGQGSLAGFTALVVNPIVSGLGGGTRLLADFQINGVSKVKIDSSGNSYFKDVNCTGDFYLYDGKAIKTWDGTAFVDSLTTNSLNQDITLKSSSLGGNLYLAIQNTLNSGVFSFGGVDKHFFGNSQVKLTTDLTAYGSVFGGAPASDGRSNHFFNYSDRAISGSKGALICRYNYTGGFSFSAGTQNNLRNYKSAFIVDYDITETGTFGSVPYTVSGGYKGIDVEILDNRGTDTISTSMVGIDVNLLMSGLGAAVTRNLYGFRTRFSVSETRVFESGFGLFVASPLFDSNTGGFVGGINYGIYIEKQSHTLVNSGFGIYQADTTDKNFLGGSTVFGYYKFENPSGTLHTKQSRRTVSTLQDGYSASLIMEPGYDGGGNTVRHNYFAIKESSLTSGATVTDSCLFRFSNGTGTSTLLSPGTNKFTINTIDTWLKVSISGRVCYMPIYYDRN